MYLLDFFDGWCASIDKTLEVFDIDNRISENISFTGFLQLAELSG